jgi:hypothetical protein
MVGHSIPKKDVNFLAEKAFHTAMEFVTDEEIDLLKCKFEIIAIENEIPDYLNGKWEPRTTVAWKITVKE